VLLGGVAPAASAAGRPGTTVRTGLGHPDPPHLKTWWYDALRLSQAHRITTGRGATVAIVGDDSFSLKVPDLQGADVHMEKSCRGTRAASEPPSQLTSHGTGMAATIVGTGRGPGPGGLGYLGVAPGARVELWPVLDNCPDRMVQQQVLAAARHGADVISCSDQINGDWSRTIREINRLGAVLVAAAGNKATHGWTMAQPAGTRGVVAVTAVDEAAKAWNGDAYVTDAQLRAGSGYPTVSAPGVHLGGTGWFKGYGWSLGHFDGTSGSAAIVSGLLALVKSRYPDATADQLIQQLIHYTGGAPDHLSWDTDYGFGIASATEMLKHDPTQWPDENPLWLSPSQVIKTYPMSVRGQKHVLEKPSASPAAGAPAGTTSAGTRKTAATSASGGVPGSAWGLLALLVVLLVVGGALVLRRRRAGAQERGGPTTTTERQKQGV
jgi:hypothetical protein